MMDQNALRANFIREVIIGSMKIKYIIQVDNTIKILDISTNDQK